jgi:DNA-binding GntR family transcriptional regulator
VGEAAVSQRSTTPLEPLPRRAMLRDQVAEQLQELIVTGVLAPGERLLENELAEQLGVSRNPVREALTLIAQRGWVDLRPHHGAVVHVPTPKEVADFFHLRRVLEGEAARLAAARVTPDDLATLRAIHTRGIAAVDGGDGAELARLNADFHAVISRAADNVMLGEVLDLLKDRLEWYFRPVAIARGRDSWDEHAAILAALESGDADLAAQVVVAHASATADRYHEHHDRPQPAAGAPSADGASGQ